MEVFVLVTYGGSESTEPYVAAFSSPALAAQHYESLPKYGDGGSFFIERLVVNHPESTEQVASGPEE